MLRLNGYNTAAFGKWHLTPLWETSISGPYATWPTFSGFEKFYGFLGGETNQWAPLLYDGVAKVELPGTPNYHTGSRGNNSRARLSTRMCGSSTTHARTTVWQTIWRQRILRN